MFRTPNVRASLREKTDAIMKPFTKQLLKQPQLKNNKEFRAIIEKYRIMNEDTFKMLGSAQVMVIIWSQIEGSILIDQFLTAVQCCAFSFFSKKS